MNFGKFVAFCTYIAFENCDGKCKKRRRLKKHFFGSCPKMAMTVIDAIHVLTAESKPHDF